MAGKVSQQCAASILVHIGNEAKLRMADHNCEVHRVKQACVDARAWDMAWARSNNKVYEECA